MDAQEGGAEHSQVCWLRHANQTGWMLPFTMGWTKQKTHVFSSHATTHREPYQSQLFARTLVVAHIFQLLIPRTLTGITMAIHPQHNSALFQAASAGKLADLVGHKTFSGLVNLVDPFICLHC